ncbi:histidine kinase N-terminal 7TM domain-containing diguanylate cyclase [Fusibacter ferrireducens]|uniref:Diguanylate cyclase n=1 Tax=Fusibacter ferrireducens TaxID=2785058 RepID=A0ABR9ZSZ6_9FIRM|nr:histidine kinase N-terminal 7TM domain-containing protein [Fusibacter ferrireducens]MBF4693595.1 diguanylate cyclase [Fusibacter ferrireducens]
MNFIYFILNSVSILILLFLMALIYRNRKEKGARSFFIALACLLIWASSTSFELISTSMEHALFWRNMTQIGMAFMPVFSLIFVMEYISYKGKILKGVVIFSFISNCIILPLTFTDGQHHLIRKSVNYVIENGYYNLIIEPTFLGNGHVTFRFLLIFMVIFFLFRFQIKIFEQMKTQVITLGMGMLVTVLFLVIKHYWLSCNTDLLPMSLSFIMLYTFIAISIFKFQFLKITPLAKEWIINSLDEGIVVFSKSGKIVEVNPSAQSFFLERLSAIPLKERVSLECNNPFDLFSMIYSQVLAANHSIYEEKDSTFQKKWLVNNEMKYYEFQMHYLKDGQNNKIGAVMVIRNVSSREMEKNELIIKAEMDMQMDIYNSRGFINRFNQSLAAVGALYIVDIDHFKHINDQFGHPTGDEVLKHIVDIIKRAVGDKAILGRLGGDEFGIMLTLTEHEVCENIAEEIVERIQAIPYEQMKKNIKVTVSLGGITQITLDTVKFDQVYPLADQLLYRSKQNGRNQYTLQRYDAFCEI